MLQRLTAPLLDQFQSTTFHVVLPIVVERGPGGAVLSDPVSARERGLPGPAFASRGVGRKPLPHDVASQVD